MLRTRTTQTAFRLDSEQLALLKKKARRKKISLNAYVQGLIEADLQNNSERKKELIDSLKSIKMPVRISEEIESLTIKGISFSQQEMYADDRLAYILGK